MELSPTCNLIHERPPFWQPLHIRTARICQPVIVRPLLVSQHVCVPARMQRVLVNGIWWLCHCPSPRPVAYIMELHALQPVQHRRRRKDTGCCKSCIIATALALPEQHTSSGCCSAPAPCRRPGCVHASSGARAGWRAQTARARSTLPADS